MIRVNYFRSGDRHRLAVEGHAGYDKHGKDIVCAGVSAITNTLLAYLHSINTNLSEASASSGSVSIDCTGGEKVEAAFDMAVTGYINLSHQYPQYVVTYIASQGS